MSCQQNSRQYRCVLALIIYYLGGWLGQADSSCPLQRRGMNEQNEGPGQMTPKTESGDVPEIQEMHRWEDQDSVQGMVNGVLWGNRGCASYTPQECLSTTRHPFRKKNAQPWREI